MVCVIVQEMSVSLVTASRYESMNSLALGSTSVLICGAVSFAGAAFGDCAEASGTLRPTATPTTANMRDSFIWGTPGCSESVPTAPGSRRGKPHDLASGDAK